MTATPERIALALAACEGLTDKDLKERGPRGFLKMIERKRKYATAARVLHAAAEKQNKQIKAMSTTIADLQAKNTALIESKLDQPVENTDQAAAMLAALKISPTPKTE